MAATEEDLPHPSRDQPTRTPLTQEAWRLCTRQLALSAILSAPCLAISLPIQCALPCAPIPTD